MSAIALLRVLMGVWISLTLMLFASVSVAATTSGKKEAALAQQAAKLTPDARADFAAAMESIRAERYEEGIALLQKVAEQTVNNPVPYVNLALVYRKMGYDDRARESLERARAMDPENPVANNEYAMLLRKTGKFAEARKIYEQMLEKHPNFMMAHKNLGILCDLYMGDRECALKHYSLYSEAMPDDTTVRNWIADLRK